MFPDFYHVHALQCHRCETWHVAEKRLEYDADIQFSGILRKVLCLHQNMHQDMVYWAPPGPSSEAYTSQVVYLCKSCEEVCKITPEEINQRPASFRNKHGGIFPYGCFVECGVEDYEPQTYHHK